MSRARDLELRAAYRTCARITRRYGTTYYWGVRLLDARQRADVYAVYALCRRADDIVDAPGATSPRRVQQTTARLREFAEQFHHALGGATTTDPVLRAAAETARARSLPPAAFVRFFAAMGQDLTVHRYARFEDLMVYMDGSAAAIGELMLPILEPLTSAIAPARNLGIAFQLTNFLRDIAEDFDRGRVYLPTEDWDRFGVSPAQRHVDAAWRDFMAFQIARNRSYYAAADAGLERLPARSARCVRVARVLYSEILDRIEAADYDVFGARRRVPLRRKTGLALRTAALPLLARRGG